LSLAVAEACRRFGISRKTGHKWLRRFDEDSAQVLADRSRRPHFSPRRTAQDVEQAILKVRDDFGWGPRKIRAYLISRMPGLPSVRTCAQILERHGRVHTPLPSPPPVPFERAQPNELWQCDFKGPLEVERRRVAAFSVLDDHSRFLIALQGCHEQTTRSAWEILWEAFGRFGLPDGILCDRFFAAGGGKHLPSLSWFESRLLRLDVRCLHGRAYHPQTQGKVERFHGTLERELWPVIRRDSLANFNADLNGWMSQVYNAVRPHEALGDKPPLERYRPSLRRRPTKLPEPEYPAGSAIRKIGAVGDIRWKKYRILVGRGLVGEFVRVEEQAHEIAVYYCKHRVRLIASAQLKLDTFL
jgi:transposase InsO family protein